MGGRDDHNSKNNKALGQTPKHQIDFSDGNDPMFNGMDIEFSEEFADADDKIAQSRSEAADRRAKRRNK